MCESEQFMNLTNSLYSQVVRDSNTLVPSEPNHLIVRFDVPTNSVLELVFDNAELVLDENNMTWKLINH